MAENESLDLGGPYARRWDAVCEKVRKGNPSEQVAADFEQAIYRGLAATLKQMKQRDVTLRELLSSRDSPQRLRQLLSKCLGHEYVRLLVDAAVSSGLTETAWLTAWINGILDTVEDQICLRAAGTKIWSTIDDVRVFISNVRKRLVPAIDRIAMKLAQDPSRIPRRPPRRRRSSVGTTAELLNLSLLGGAIR